VHNYLLDAKIRKNIEIPKYLHKKIDYIHTALRQHINYMTWPRQLFNEFNLIYYDVYITNSIKTKHGNAQYTAACQKV